MRLRVCFRPVVALGRHRNKSNELSKADLRFSRKLPLTTAVRTSASLVQPQKKTSDWRSPVQRVLSVAVSSCTHDLGHVAVIQLPEA